MKLKGAVVLSLFAMLAFVLTPAVSDAKGGLEIGSTVENFTLTDTDGVTKSLNDLRGKKGTVVVWLSAQCPVVKAYKDRINEIAAEYQAKGIAFVGINSNATEDLNWVKSNKAEFGYNFPILIDKGNVLADKWGASVTPEVFYLDSKNVLLYHGAIDNDRRSVTLVHKGNIMKFTEGLFRDVGYQVAQQEFGAQPIDGGPWCAFKNPDTGREIVVKDAIADAFLQQILLRPAEYDVIACCNLNGDYISDALAAQVGGIGIAPGANISDQYACFEATHGTAPKYAGLDKVNPGSIILSAEMMLRHLGWREAADLVIKAMEAAIGDKIVTYDFARLMEGATEVSCSAFGDAMIARM